MTLRKLQEVMFVVCSVTANQCSCMTCIAPKPPPDGKACGPPQVNTRKWKSNLSLSRCNKLFNEFLSLAHERCTGTTGPGSVGNTYQDRLISGMMRHMGCMGWMLTLPNLHELPLWCLPGEAKAKCRKKSRWTSSAYRTLWVPTCPLMRSMIILLSPAM